MIHFILTRFIHISANIILSKTTNTQHSIPPPKPPPPQSHQTYALGLCRECHLHSRYFPHNALLYPCIPPDSHGRKYWYCKRPPAFLRHRYTGPYRYYRDTWDTWRSKLSPAYISDNAPPFP